MSQATAAAGELPQPAPSGALMDPVLGQLEDSLFRFARTVASMRVHSYAQDAPCDRAGLAVLHILEHAGELRLSELAGALGLDPSTVSRQVRALEDSGLVTRREDPADRRAYHLALTGTGLAALGDVRQRRRELLAAALADWRPRDRERLAGLLGRLADDLGVVSGSLRSGRNPQ